MIWTSFGLWNNKNKPG